MGMRKQDMVSCLANNNKVYIELREIFSLQTKSFEFEIRL